MRLRGCFAAEVKVRARVHRTMQVEERQSSCQELGARTYREETAALLGALHAAHVALRCAAECLHQRQEALGLGRVVGRLKAPSNRLENGHSLGAPKPFQR